MTLSWWDRLSWTTEELRLRQTVVDGCDTIKSLLVRNLVGYDRCYSAILQLLLIKKYRPDSVFRYLNYDVLIIIIRLVHNTRRTSLWCHSRK